MDFSQIFGVFSRRDKLPAKASTLLTQNFKYRVVQLCVDTLVDYDFWREVHRGLQYHVGRPIRSTLPIRAGLEPQSHTLGFLEGCSDEHFLDFVEIVFQSESMERHRNWEVAKRLVRDINTFLKVDDLPYSLTAFVTISEANPPYITHRVVARPRIIRRENELLHDTAIEPTLTLLTNPVFASANEEFLEALEDYRKGDYKDSVAKCASSLESVMKVICDRKGWSHPGNADATVLLKTILTRASLPQFFKSHIQIIPIIRNELSSAHGAGTQQRVLSEHVANFVINSTASTIVLLVEETTPST